MLYCLPSPSENFDDKIWNTFEKNLHTDIDTQTFKYDLDGVEDLQKRLKVVFNLP
jgi:hypothetical protein